MPPSRFAQVSPYRNLLAIPSKREAFFSELPVSVNGSDATDLIASTSSYWLAKGSGVGSLICQPFDKPGKAGNKAPTFVASPGGISDFVTSDFDDLLAAGSEKGDVSVYKLPESIDPTDLQPPVERATSFPPATPGKPVDRLAFHSTSSSLLASSSGSSVTLYDCAAGKEAVSIVGGAERGQWDVKWSLDGKTLAGAGKDSTVRLWDPRATGVGGPLTGEVKAHHGLNKPIRLAWVGDALLTVGTNKLRDREFMLFDPRALSSPLHTSRIDSGSTGVLIPLVDESRKLVYLFGRGDASMRWIDVSQPSPLTLSKSSTNFGSYNSPLPVSVAGAAISPINHGSVNVMKAELSRFAVLGKGGEVIEVVMQAPKRSYLDFHGDVMPDVKTSQAAQSAGEWLSGGDKQVELVSQDPARSRQAPTLAKAANTAAPAPASAQPVADPTPVAPPAAVAAPPPPPVQKQSVSVGEPPSSALSPIATQRSDPPPPELTSRAAPTGSPAPTAASSDDAHPTTGAASYGVKPRTGDEPPRRRGTAPTSGAETSNRWSRKFLGGKTPLKTDYDDLHNLSSTFSPDNALLRCSRTLFYFPLGGPGGRLGVHRISDKQRLPFAVPSLLSGAGVVDFAPDPFDDSRVFVAADDGKIRIFSVPQDGLAADHGEPDIVLGDSAMDRVAEIRPHPTARDVLLSVSHDKGTATARVWDIGQRSAAIVAPLQGGQVLSSAWSSNGARLAYATKQKKLYVVDPRQKDAAPISGPSHESLRTVHLAWVDDAHLLTTGFSRSAMRELILHRIGPDSTTIVARKLFDVSPAPLFLHFDPDTSILYLWSKGERTLYTAEVHPEDGEKAFDSLPPFAHSTLQSGWAFLPKTVVDVRRVEIAKALRLTPTSVEAVSFTIPRARAEFFQDDVFPPTADLNTPALTAAQWFDGANIDAPRIDLRPEGMKLLSDAPLTQVQTNQRAKIATGPVLTDSQKREQYLDKLFSTAQEQGSQSTGNYVGDAAKGSRAGDSDEEQVGRSRVGAPDDDDW